MRPPFPWFRPVFSLVPLLAQISLAEPLPAPSAPATGDFTLPEGFVAELVAGPPLTRHPMMGTLDDRGRLFVAEASGVNLNKEELEREKPNLVRLLEDRDGDGVFDHSTVFADGMTFPQGALWLDGWLYVASPPGLWRLRDTDDDGIADEREQIVTGFDYTGNAADVHGPFLHPDGRIYWCHGRKGHEVKQQDGTLVSAGKGARIWSCQPDGSDIRVHAGGGMDNPVEIDFTPEGEIIGSINLFHGRPRGDVLVHWLRGGRYPRTDQGPVLEEFKSTGPLLPEAHNFGHVAVSGMCIARGPWFANRNPDELDVLTTFFNTGEIARTTLVREGSAYVSRSSDLLIKRNRPDVHFTDVLEDRDGSLLVIDTGGWFRIGCPTSQLAKPEIAGSIHRIRRADVPYERKPAPPRPAWNPPSPSARLAALESGDAPAARRAAEALGAAGNREAVAPLVRLLGKRPDRSLEHSAIWALIEINDFDRTLAALRDQPAAWGSGLWALDQMDASRLQASDVLGRIDAGSRDAAFAISRRRQEWTGELLAWLGAHPETERWAELHREVLPHHLGSAAARSHVTALLDGPHEALALDVIAAMPDRTVTPAEWVGPLRRLLLAVPTRDAALRSLGRLEPAPFQTELPGIAADDSLPARTRLLALRAMSRSGALTDAEFPLVQALLGPGATPSDRMEVAPLLQYARFSPARLVELAGTLAAAGPLEFPSLLGAFSKSNDPVVGGAVASALAVAPAAESVPSATLAQVLDRFPPEQTAIARERMVALRSLEEGRLARLESLVPRVAREGKPERGREIFAAGKGACTGCHRVGETGIDLGPDLSHIGRIRSARDLLESVLFPGASLARDFEAYQVTRRDGAALIGLIRRETPASLTLALPGGASLELDRAEIASVVPAPVSLMPAGLEAGLTEEELLDLVAWLDGLE